jgi:tetratricopeptide (TPR) repeat protein
VQLYQRAEKRNPDHADLQNNLGFAYRNLKQYDLAFKHYKRAIELDPRHRGAHEYIGEAYLMTGDLARRGEAPRGAQGDLPVAVRGVEGSRTRG